MSVYQVVTVEDDDLPEGHDWALVEMTDPAVVFIVKRSAGSRFAAWAEAWAAYRMITEGRSLSALT